MGLLPFELLLGYFGFWALGLGFISCFVPQTLNPEGFEVREIGVPFFRCFGGGRRIRRVPPEVPIRCYGGGGAPFRVEEGGPTQV